MIKDDGYVGLFKENLYEWEWILEMAQNGVQSTEGAGDDPRNVFLYMLQCDLKKAKEES